MEQMLRTPRSIRGEGCAVQGLPAPAALPRDSPTFDDEITRLAEEYRDRAIS